jgi:hypothetical protein
MAVRSRFFVITTSTEKYLATELTDFPWERGEYDGEGTVYGDSFPF